MNRCIWSDAYSTHTSFPDLDLSGSTDMYYGTYIGGLFDMYLASFNNSTYTQKWCTYFGTSGSDEEFNAISIDINGDIYLGGVVFSSGLPTIPGSTGSHYDDEFSNGTTGNSDGFLLKLSSAYKNAYCTYLGGSLSDKVIALSAVRNFNNQSDVIVVGSTSSQPYSTTIPVTVQDAFPLKNYSQSGIDYFDDTPFATNEIHPFIVNIHNSAPFARLASHNTISENQLNSLNIFPNPTEGSLNIVGNLTSIYKIRIFNQLGSLLKELVIGGENEVLLDLEGFPSGLYILETTTDSGLFMNKIIINN